MPNEFRIETRCHSNLNPNATQETFSTLVHSIKGLQCNRYTQKCQKMGPKMSEYVTRYKHTEMTEPSRMKNSEFLSVFLHHDNILTFLDQFPDISVFAKPKKSRISKKL